MPQNMSPHAENWYTARPDRETASDWYRAGPARPEQGRTAPQEPTVRREMTAQQRRRHRRTKIISLSVCGVLVCAALVLAVWNGSLLSRMTVVLERSPVPSFGVEGGYDYDFSFGGDQLPSEETYEDFREYFENHFTGTVDIGLPTAPTGTGVTLPLHARQEDELTLQEIYDAVSPAVVGITTYVDELEYGWGTGVVFTPDGYIITNTHVLQGCTGAKVAFADGGEYEARLVGADEASDIAVLYIGGEDLPCAQFGSSDALQVGDTAVAIGNPLGQAYTGTMTNGIISAIDRNVTYEGHTMTLLQTNAALNEGNSGGPLINAGGQVIGITNMKIMSSYYTTVEGIGFAIPSAVVKRIADQLIEHGLVLGEPTIGIVAGPVGSEAMSLYDLPNGIYITQVNQGSDALEKGLQAGDVVTAVNGESVSTVAQVNAIKEGKKVGDSLTLSVWRDGETFDLEIVLVDKADIKE